MLLGLNHGESSVGRSNVPNILPSPFCSLFLVANGCSIQGLSREVSASIVSTNFFLMFVLPFWLLCYELNPIVLLL